MGVKMKSLVIFFIVTFITISQDFNQSGLIIKYDLNGDGFINQNDHLRNPLNRIQTFTDFNSTLNFSEFWSSPAGAFTNCWDGIVGYFDGDTLLDVAGFTFSPAKFYIYEQVAGNPDSFALVQEFIKTEGGSYGPITAGDTDGDGKIEIISPDVLGIARVYIYENDGNNNYVAQATFSHPSNSQGGQGVYIGDLNKNGKKEIIVLRGSSSPGGGEVRVWEHSGAIGTNTYTNIYSYTTVTYIFGKGGYGDSDNDGWDEVLLTFGGFPIFNTFIRRIEFDSSSSSFQHLIFEAGSIGFPTAYKVYDLDNNGSKELISTNNSNGMAASYVYRSTGANSFAVLDSIFESADNNSMLSLDIRVFTGNSLPSAVYGSFNGRVYVYNLSGSNHTKEYENLNYPGPAIRRVYWVLWSGFDGYFNTWSGTNSNGTFYIFKRDDLIGINNNQFPVSFKLYQNYPNPFNPKTVIAFHVPDHGFYSLKVYDILGREVETLVNKDLQHGNYEVNWDASDYPSGVYFYKLVSGVLPEFGETKKMVLIR
jgi:hypothetical protein